MKLISFYKEYSLYSEVNYTGFSFQWSECLEIPFMTIEKLDQDYYSYIIFELRILTHSFFLEIRLKKQPYRNKKQYLAWRKENVIRRSNETK